MLYGTILVVFPTIVLVCIIEILIKGSIFGNDLSIYPVSSTSTTSTSTINPVLDYFSYLGDTISTDDLNTSRMVTGLLGMGLYYFKSSLYLLIPDKPTYYQEAYDNNSWEYYSWKRINFIFFSVLVSLVNIFAIFISFEEYFTDNNVYFIVFGFKFFGIIVEEFAEYHLRDGLLIIVFSTIFEIVAGISTFGANSLIAFLIQDFIDWGYQIIERSYFDEVIDGTKTFFTNQIKK